MNRYVLSIFQPAETHPDPEALGNIMSDVDAVMAEIEAADALVLNAGLQPQSSAKVVRPSDQEFLMTDGAFAETKEHLGGFVVVQAADERAALEWGRKLSRATTLPIEVRGFAQNA